MNFVWKRFFVVSSKYARKFYVNTSCVYVHIGEIKDYKYEYFPYSALGTKSCYL